MRSSRRKLLSRLMCFVMGLSCGTNAGAHQKKKSSSNESLNLPEWIVVGSSSMMLYEIILKPLGSRLLSRSGNNNNDKKNSLLNEKKKYIEKVLDSIDKVEDEGSEYGWLRTIPKSLGKIRMALHCLFLNYSNKEGGYIANAKLTIGEKIDWSFTHGEENYVSLDGVRKILKWYHDHSSIVFFNDVTPIEKFGFVIQKWAKEMGFKSVEIVMDGVGSYYADDHDQSPIELKIHGFKYQLSDEERQILMDKLGLQDGDALDLISDEEKNMEDKNNENIILLEYDNNNDDDDEDDEEEH